MAAAQFTIYKKEEENLDEYASRGGAKKKRPKAAVTDPRAAAALQTKVEEPSFFPKEETKKGGKFVPLYSKEGKEADVIKLAGRHLCECQAVKHSLVSNCLSCGRIVCSQEGSGPCLFCGNLVVTREEQIILDRKSKKSEQLYKKLAGGDSRDKYQASHQKAMDNKERLLEFDANCEKRTRVIDDESDYFAVDTNKWLTPQQREALRKKKEELHAEKHKSRLDRRITFDFAGRKVLEDDSVPEYDITQDTKLLELFKDDAFSVASEISRRAEEGSIANPNSDRGRPIYNESVGGRGLEGRAMVRERDGQGRVQDSGLMEMSDQGMCLSMHQPYASLLVMGIKIHEGRTWYSQHRGRLWIHAGSKVPLPEEIQEVENFYVGRNEGVTFPQHYPTSCLLGSIDVTDCLPQEQYQETHPKGESSSPYVLVCRNPQELVVKFPMQGQHKIYKLDPGVEKLDVKLSHD